MRALGVRVRVDVVRRVDVARVDAPLSHLGRVVSAVARPQKSGVPQPKDRHLRHHAQRQLVGGVVGIAQRNVPAHLGLVRRHDHLGGAQPRGDLTRLARLEPQLQRAARALLGAPHIDRGELLHFAGGRDGALVAQLERERHIAPARDPSHAAEVHLGREQLHERDAQRSRHADRLKRGRSRLVAGRRAARRARPRVGALEQYHASEVEELAAHQRLRLLLILGPPRPGMLGLGAQPARHSRQPHLHRRRPASLEHEWSRALGEGRAGLLRARLQAAPRGSAGQLARSVHAARGRGVAHSPHALVTIAHKARGKRQLACQLDVDRQRRAVAHAEGAMRPVRRKYCDPLPFVLGRGRLPQRRQGRPVGAATRAAWAHGVAGHVGEQRKLVLQLERRCGGRGSGGERHGGGHARHGMQRAGMQQGKPRGALSRQLARELTAVNHRVDSQRRLLVRAVQVAEEHGAPVEAAPPVRERERQLGAGAGAGLLGRCRHGEARHGTARRHDADAGRLDRFPLKWHVLRGVA